MSQVLTQTYPFAFAGQKPTMDPKERFYRQFKQEVTDIQEKINQLGSVAKIGGERQDATETILAGISRLSSEVADASDFVPAYDQRTYSEALKALTDQLNEETSRLASKGRFQFKPRSAASAPSVDLQNFRGTPVPAPAGQQPAAAQDESDSLGALPTFPKNYNEEIAKPGKAGIRKPSFSAAREVAISDHTGLHIILPSTASRAASSGSLTNLSGCVVDMSIPTAGRAAFLGLALKNIANSLIIAGHVNGPAHVTGIRDSILVVAARQVRMHECKNVDVYLYCSSRPIIEDCSGMRFAPIPQDFLTENEDWGSNQWDQVDDFKWLKAEHSPNWSVLPEHERIADDTWKNTVPGGPAVGTEDILKKVGITGRAA